MSKVLLIGTFETKRTELDYLAAALGQHGLDVQLMDVSLDSQGAVWSGTEKLAKMAAKAKMAAEQIAAQCSECSIAIGLGGGTGGEIVLAAMRGLPAAYPKVLITTLAFDPRPALADSAITIIPTLCDVEGLNTQLRQVFENAAAAVAGLANAHRVTPSGRQNIAITTLGVTGQAGTHVARELSARAYETTVFHSNGYGGAAFTRFVTEGYAAGVVDLNVHELGRMRLAGAYAPMPERFRVARALPRVVLPGGLNFLGLGAPETIAPVLLERAHYRHTQEFTHIKLSLEEMTNQAEALAAALNESEAPCQVVLPMGGFSHEDRPGGAIEDIELRDICADILTQAARAYTVTRLPHHINDPQTAHATVAALDLMLTQGTANA